MTSILSSHSEAHACLLQAHATWAETCPDITLQEFTHCHEGILLGGDVYVDEIEKLVNAPHTFRGREISKNGRYLIRWILTYMATQAYCFEALSAAKNSDASWSFLVKSTMLYGVVLGMSIADEAMLKKTEVERQKTLREAGLFGAKTKHKGTQDLKDWALEKSKGMRGAPADIARKLGALIPLELAGKSKNPERLIYETLLKKDN